MTLLFEGRGLDGNIWEALRAHCRSLHYATPDFLLTLVALVHFMRPSLRKGAHAALSIAAWQEIRVRSGRDDNSSWKLYLAFPNKIFIPSEPRDLRCASLASQIHTDSLAPAIFQ
jgi:hypothetical protein